MDANIYNILAQMLNSGGLRNNQAGNLVEQIIAQRGVDDPKLQLLLQYFAQRKAEAEAEDDEDIDNYTEAEDSAQHQGQEPRQPQNDNRQAVRQVQEKITALYVELREMRRRNQTFALAVGACQHCWGND